MRILVVEDDPGIRSLVRRALEEVAMSVDAVASAEEALHLVPDGAFDALVVDLMLPGADGLTFLEQCRSRGVSAPVLILSARRSVDDRVRGLEAGGDDYLPKPFAVAELVARVRALLRRGSGGQATDRFEVGELELDLRRFEARRAGKPLGLSPREFQILEVLVRNRRRVLTRTMILDHVWNLRFEPAANVIDVHIHRLRAKLDKGFERPLIRTVRGVGYVLEI